MIGGTQPFLIMNMKTQLVSFATLFRNTRTGLFAVALSLATLTPVIGQSAVSVLFYGPNDSTESYFLPANATFTVCLT